MNQLASHGKSAYHIVMAHPVHETVKFACDEFHDFFYKVTGVSLPVTTELQPACGPEILIGDSVRLWQLGISLSEEGLGEEGFILRAVGEHIVLAGATPRGTLYAVYAFLEECLGCRWYASNVAHIPRRLEVALPAFDRRETPAFESREAYWRDACDGLFAVRNRLNGNKADISVRQGGRQKWFNFHHSYDDLVPTRVYFDAHPEYYSLVDGQRLRERNQLCLTHPDVLRIAEATLRRWIAENPDCTVFSIAQNDWDHHCTCEACIAVERAEGSPSGSVIAFVNHLAEAIEDDFPHVLLHTFAYQYTRKAPRTIRPRPNVIVRLCNIECCFSHPLDGTLADGIALMPEAMQPQGRQCAAHGQTPFLKDLVEWSAICQRLYVWDYATNFSNYLMPFPNLLVLQKNLRLFRNHGVKGVLEQGDFAHGGGAHLAELQAYVQAKLLWNPDVDMAYHIADFLAGYYGSDAAPLIQEYMDLWQAAVAPWHIGMYERADAPYITDALLLASDRLLCEAMHLTREAEIRRRIDRLRLGITYMLICRLPLDTPGREVFVERFGWQCRAHGVGEIHERWPLEASLDEMKASVCGPKGKCALRSDYKM